MGPAGATSVMGLTALVFAVLLLGPRKAGEPARFVRLATGLVSSAIAIAMFALAWPLDWLSPKPSTRAAITVSGHRLEYVQSPGIDFYADRLVISAGQERQAFIALNVDNYKCWVGVAIRSGDRVTFRCWPLGMSVSISVSWLTSQLLDCRATPCDLSSPYYDSMRTRP